MTTNALIACQNLSLRAGQQILHRNITLTLMPQTILHVQGPNGSGKSTLLKILAGQLRAAQGQIRYAVNKREILYLPQLHTPDLHCPISLKEIALLDASAEAMHLVERFEWFPASVAEKTWNNASGGERMRALLARALSSPCRVLLLDEPFNHLDRQAHSTLFKSLNDFIQQGDRAIIIVSHEPLQQTQEPDHSAGVIAWSLTSQGHTST